MKLADVKLLNELEKQLAYLERHYYDEENGARVVKVKEEIDKV
jgi:hypothetical protein